MGRQVLALTLFMVRGRERHELVNFSHDKSHHGEAQDAEGLIAATPDLGGTGGQHQGGDVGTFGELKSSWQSTQSRWPWLGHQSEA